MKEVSIIIVNYKTPQLCIDCIESVMANTESVDYEIILIDNGSNDESYDILKNKLPQSVRLLFSEENLGFGRANNKAAECAEGKYLFFLNSDTLIENNVIKAMAEYLESDEKVGTVGVSLYNAERKPVKSYGSFPSMKTCIKVALSILRKNLGINKKAQISNISNGEQNQVPFEVDYIMGADMMMRADLFRKLGGFDKNIFMYFEESELQLRAKQTGYIQMILPKEYILHLEGKSMRESNFKRIAYNRSMMYYFKKHCGKIKFKSFKSVLFCIYMINNRFDKNYNKEENALFLELFNPVKNNDYKA